MASLNQLPAFVLCLAILGLLRWMPADRGWVKEDLSSLERSEPRAFRIPLVPADQHADLAIAGFPGAKASVAWREVKLFVIEGVIGNVHLAIDAFDRAIGLDDHRRVVIKARRAPFEKRSNNDRLVLSRQLTQSI